MFKPARNKAYRLHMYGINHHVPCISAQLCLNDEPARALHTAMASLTKPIKLRDVSTLHEGRYEVKEAKITKRGPPPWQHIVDSNGTTMLQKYIQKALEDQKCVDQSPVNVQPTSFLLQFHLCATNYLTR